MALVRLNLHDTRLHPQSDRHYHKNPYAHTLEISQRPDFRILTSLVWIRTHEDDNYSDSKIFGISHLKHYHDDTTICSCRPDLGLLRLHRDRLATAAEALGWRHLQALDRSEYGVQTLRASIKLHLRSLPKLPPDARESRKLRILVSKGGTLSIDSTVMKTSSVGEIEVNPFMPTTLNLQRIDGPVCRVFVDTRSTHAGFFTTYKTSHRVLYDAARNRAGVMKASPTDQEVLLYNNEGEIMETSCCTVYFNREGQWVTPAAICGSNLGVTRRLALDAGLCKQGLIELADLEDGELVWLSNAARGFFLGQICLDRDSPPLPPTIPNITECIPE